MVAEMRDTVIEAIVNSTSGGADKRTCFSANFISSGHHSGRPINRGNIEVGGISDAIFHVIRMDIPSLENKEQILMRNSLKGLMVAEWLGLGQTRGLLGFVPIDTNISLVDFSPVRSLKNHIISRSSERRSEWLVFAKRMTPEWFFIAPVVPETTTPSKLRGCRA